MTPEKEWRTGFRDIVDFERTLETAFVHLARGSAVLCDQGILTRSGRGLRYLSAVAPQEIQRSD